MKNENDSGIDLLQWFTNYSEKRDKNGSERGA